MRAVARAALVASGAFVAMEAVAYASHRWLMHGPGMAWHRSHHAPREGRFERNDLFPAVFAGLTVTAMAVGQALPRGRRDVLAVGAGVTAYGAAYMVVHDGLIHERMGERVAATGRRPGLRRLVEAHGRHHASAGEPFGMLVPLGGQRVAEPRPA